MENNLNFNINPAPPQYNWQPDHCEIRNAASYSHNAPNIPTDPTLFQDRPQITPNAKQNINFFQEVEQIPQPICVIESYGSFIFPPSWRVVTGSNPGSVHLKYMPQAEQPNYPRVQQRIPFTEALRPFAGASVIGTTTARTDTIQCRPTQGFNEPQTSDVAQGLFVMDSLRISTSFVIPGGSFAFPPGWNVGALGFPFSRWLHVCYTEGGKFLNSMPVVAPFQSSISSGNANMTANSYPSDDQNTLAYPPSTAGYPFSIDPALLVNPCYGPSNGLEANHSLHHSVNPTAYLNHEANTTMTRNPKPTTDGKCGAGAGIHSELPGGGGKLGPGLQHAAVPTDRPFIIPSGGSSTYAGRVATKPQYVKMNWREKLQVRMGCWKDRSEYSLRVSRFRKAMAEGPIGIHLDRYFEEYNYDTVMLPNLVRVQALMEEYYGWDLVVCQDLAIRVCWDRTKNMEQKARIDELKRKENSRVEEKIYPIVEVNAEKIVLQTCSEVRQAKKVKLNPKV